MEAGVLASNFGRGPLVGNAFGSFAVMISGPTFDARLNFNSHTGKPGQVRILKRSHTTQLTTDLDIVPVVALKRTENAAVQKEVHHDAVSPLAEM
jgi:hypothetical protein